jgi:hypothetical protein
VAKKIARRKRPPPDLIVHDQGSIFLLFSMTPTGDAWTEEHISDDATRMGRAVVVEHRYIEDIINGAMSDGLYVLVVQR